MQDQWYHKIFSVDSGNFEAVALDIFRFQYEQNPVYRQYVQALHVDPARVQEYSRIPFLPIRFFKSHTVSTTVFEPELVFESSGTTGMTNSRHFVKEAGLYEASFKKAFELFYGPVSDWCVIGLLPSYLERGNSSLVYMADSMIRESASPESGFYLDDYAKLAETLYRLEQKKQKTLLIGVTFALLDFAEQYPVPLKHTIVMETGGMKGRRKEMIREELHAELQQAFSISAVHSEYGMTELLSQAYSSGNGLLATPPWMRVQLRDEEDPLIPAGRNTGLVNVTDLANVYSCSFIATDDVGRLHTDSRFEILGRMDNSDLRGCSLMVV